MGLFYATARQTFFWSIALVVLDDRYLACLGRRLLKYKLLSCRLLVDAALSMLNLLATGCWLLAAARRVWTNCRHGSWILSGLDLSCCLWLKCFFDGLGFFIASWGS